MCTLHCYTASYIASLIAITPHNNNNATYTCTILVRKMYVHIPAVPCRAHACTDSTKLCILQRHLSNGSVANCKTLTWLLHILEIRLFSSQFAELPEISRSPIRSPLASRLPLPTASRTTTVSSSARITHHLVSHPC